jgi:hypothetical protein
MDPAIDQHVPDLAFVSTEGKEETVPEPGVVHPDSYATGRGIHGITSGRVIYGRWFPRHIQASLL